MSDATTTQPAAKRVKTEPSWKEWVAPSILPQVDDFAAQYRSNKPYPHVIFPEVFQPDFLDRVLNEIKQTSSMTFKESDLFKFYQSIDLANLQPKKNKDDDDNDKINSNDDESAVLQLRSVLYSPEWRAFMEQVAGLPADTLADRVDCACNCHTTGCHLLCHDDVISTRCLSYILYLTGDNWQASEGGGLELYPSSSTDATVVPDTSPSVVHLPLHNHLAMFKVEPGVSFHAVQEVMATERPRLSLQGWYHYRDPKAVENYTHAPTLAMLKQKKKRANKCDETEHVDKEAMGAQTNNIHDDDSTGPGPYQPLDSTDATDKEPPSTDTNDQDNDNKTPSLSQQDIDFLKPYLNPTYLDMSEVKRINDAFQNESAVQLQDFFLNAVIPTSADLEAADEALEKANNDKNDTTSKYNRGLSEAWKLVGPPHKQRFLECSHHQSKDDLIASRLSTLQRTVLETPIFARWLAAATHLPAPTGLRGRTRRFRRGLDYTVAHHGLLLAPDDPPVLDATVCFVVNDNEKKNDQDSQETKAKEATSDAKPEDDNDVSWESGNVGGFECYIEADDDDNDQPDEEYQTNNSNNDEEDNTELLSVSATNNTLSLVLRDTGTMRFVKYVSSRAPSSRWDIAMEYQIPDDGQDDDDDDQADEPADTD